MIGKKLSLSVLVVLTIMLMFFVGTVYAYYEETEAIDSQMGRVYVSDSSYAIQLVANITSWYRMRILPTKTYEWEWIIFDPAMIFCQTSGTIFIGFTSYITIQSYSLTLSCGQGNYTAQGGIGYSWLEIYINGSSFWDLYLRTNYISSNYWGLATPITLSAITEGYSNTTIVDLQI